MNSNESVNYEDFKINVKIKLAFLWASVTLCYLYGDYFELYVPKQVEGLLHGENILNSPVKLLTASVLLSVPAIMIVLSLTLKPKYNRMLNILFGIFFTAIMLFIAFTSITPWRMFYVFFAIVESVITALIVWFAWKWPDQNNLNRVPIL